MEKELLKEELKKIGIDLAEESVKDLIERIFAASKLIIAATPNKYDDMALPLIELAKAAALDAADKIDGQEG